MPFLRSSSLVGVSCLLRRARAVPGPWRRGNPTWCLAYLPSQTPISLVFRPLESQRVPNGCWRGGSGCRGVWSPEARSAGVPCPVLPRSKTALAKKREESGRAGWNQVGRVEALGGLGVRRRCAKPLSRRAHPSQTRLPPLHSSIIWWSPSIG